MSTAKLEIQGLLSNKSEYDKSIQSLLTSIQRSRDKNQIIKNIILFCKNSLSITSKAITKYLVIRLINDIINRIGFQEIAHLIEVNILKKVLDLSLNYQKSKMNNLSDQDKRIYQEFIQNSIDSIYYWSKQANNKKSSFYQAVEQLKERQIEPQKDIRQYTFAKSSIQLRSSSNNRKRAKSVSYEDDERVFKLLDTFEQIQLFVNQQFNKSSKLSSYKIKISEILERLTQFTENFKDSEFSLHKGSQYSKLLEYVSISEQFLSKFEGKKSVVDKQIRRYIQDIFFDRQEIHTEPPKRKMQYSEGVKLKKLDIFQILQNIHRRIQNQQKAQGVFGNYEMKNVLIQDEQKYQFAQKNKTTHQIRGNRFT